MIYITDVSKQDNHFSLIPKSHYKKIYNFDESRFEENDINSTDQIKILGKKGTAVLFDTNLISLACLISKFPPN